MICKECEAEGLKSTVHLGVSSTTLMAWSSGYYDEEGVWVALENPNKIHQDYKCSNGHSWTEVT